jgi:hypothetical protein
MERETKPAAALARSYNQEDREVEVIHKLYDTVTFQRGMGDSGRKIEVTEMECAKCGFDRTLREHRVSPVERDSVGYFCLCPGCPHYVGDTFSYAQPFPAREAHTVEE